MQQDLGAGQGSGVPRKRRPRSWETLADLPTGRRDYSRSPPPRTELPYDDEPPGSEDRRAGDRSSYRQHEHGAGGGRERDRGYHGDRRRDDAYPARGKHDEGGSDREYHRDREGYDRPRGYPRYDSDDGDHRWRRDDYDSRRRSRSPARALRNYASRSPSPVQGPGVPNATVIFEGLSSVLPTSELRSILLASTSLSQYPAVEVRLPTVKSGSRRAFVQFNDIDDAVHFMRENHPTFTVDDPRVLDEGADGANASIYVHYARNRDEHDGRPPLNKGPNWACPSCDFSNYSTRLKCKSCGGPQSGSGYGRPKVTGETDASNQPSQILVVLGLNGAVDESTLASELKRLEIEEKADAGKDKAGRPALKSTAPTNDTTGYGARKGSIHRIFLMRDRETNESLKYGFVEFWTLGDAVAALAKVQVAREFKVVGKPATVASIHTGVFVPELRDPSPDLEHLSFFPIFNPAVRVKYWEPSVFPSEMVLTSQPPSVEDPAANEDADAKKSKKRKADGAAGAGASKKSAPMMVGQMAMWQKKSAEIHGDSPAASKSALDPGREATSTVSKNGSQKAPMKISLTSATVTAAQQGAIAEPPSAPASTGAKPSPTPEPAVSYVDMEKVCCLICMMQYKSLEDLGKHERSRNHKTATEDEAKVKAALPRLAKRDQRLQQKSAEDTATTDASGPQYRDRAKERRQAFSQPNKPSAKPAQQKQKPAQEQTPAEAPPSQQQQQQQQQQPKSKGSSMLAKMGWTAGKGLGANGEGRTEAVETKAYQEGVGLGAEGGSLGDAAVVAESKTRGDYGAYVNMHKEKARERYNKMG